MNRKEEAIQFFKYGFNCSQAVLSVFSEDLNLDRETALKISAGFGGGMRKGHVCGAVSGAIMAIGLKFGHYKSDVIEAKGKIYSLTEEFIKQFEHKHGTIICKELLGYDLSKPEEKEILNEKGIFDAMCPIFVKDSTEIFEDILDFR